MPLPCFAPLLVMLPLVSGHADILKTGMTASQTEHAMQAAHPMKPMAHTMGTLNQESIAQAFARTHGGALPVTIKPPPITAVVKAAKP